METTLRRYRIRTRPFLCLDAAEAADTGVTVGEETIEELVLIPNPGFGFYQLYAVIINKPDDEIRNTPVMKRGEIAFEKRTEAAHYAKKRGEPYILCGVKETRPVSKEEIEEYKSLHQQDNSIEKKLKELKMFDTRNKT
ncbi:MAG TPA: hypothetical protein PK303_03245 [bacterium]|nr:hypothetical protein [bacterium]HOL35434.1 hypothetical protein [bacterium]HPP08121.1 hypothetical protein [bacterium]